MQAKIENLTSMIDAYLRKEHSYKISARFSLKPWSLRLFWKRSPEPEEEQDE